MTEKELYDKIYGENTGTHQATTDEVLQNLIEVVVEHITNHSGTLRDFPLNFI